jgi:hypothetical protein
MKKDKEEKIPGSVASMSPEYPKYRDALIIGVAGLVLVGVLVGGYFSIRGVDSAFREFTQRPLSLLESLRDRHDAYGVCESFLRHNMGLFRELGPGIRFTQTKDSIHVSDGEKRITVIFKAQGIRERRDVIFQLREDKGEWVIQYVGLERRDGQYRIVYSK